jgi:hypothetical protein
MSNPTPINRQDGWHYFCRLAICNWYKVRTPVAWWSW